MSLESSGQVETLRTSSITNVISKLIHDPMGAVGLLIVVSFLLVAIFAGVLAPYDPNKIDILNKLQGPSLQHLVGTDQLGRDTLSRLIHGTQIALLVAVVSIGLAVLMGSILGAIAGYGPAWLDFLIMLIFDTMRSYPVIMFALAVVVLFGPSLTTIMVIIMATSFPTYGRLMRTQTQTLRKSEYILSAQALGIGTPRILLKHVMPNTIGPILIVASMDVPFVIALEAGLSFLGLGVRPPTPSWGSILNDGYTYIRNSSWILFSAGAPLILVTIGFTFLGEQLRDILDPKIGRGL
ncbi:MAG TPA: peptide ABC transporter permease [Betaproteobacteria bacterium]|jgi:peptide/nickel transport system permease protein|nr:peptide ABC transporter permease [Betaproteobacteria bacterium]